MYDPRLDRLADVLVNYSTAVRPGDLVRLSGPPVARPLVVALYRAVLNAGGHPHVDMAPDECDEIKLESASEGQLRYEDPLDLFTVERIDVAIRVKAEDNTKALSGTDPRKQALLSQARKKPMARFLARAGKGELRWVTTQFPCHAAAQDAQMSLAAYERFVFEAGLLGQDDPAAAWQEVSRRQQHLTDYLNRSEEIRLTTPQGTDLRLGVQGRTWINCDGKANFPDGEVFTGPIEDATEGVVCYSFPAVHGGREVDGIRLQFKHGRVVDASAARGEEFLLAMLDQDQGARTLGEIALGTNYSVRQFTKNTLFDEKIGGTFHAALGAAYPETGGTNRSGLHWDMVCDLRQGGKVLVDGRLVSENGRFLDPTWPQP
ncbi:MAG: peptidase M29 [Planctomycetes bacterium RBG_16_64_12]|nr:MAG: peptidase M29 [Planctomycetes bacterium RBG_16_64_12]